MTTAERRDIRNMRRRKRFVYVEESIPLYARPCGCDLSNLPRRILCYYRSKRMVAQRVDDEALVECRACGAVWRIIDLKLDDLWTTARELEQDPEWHRHMDDVRKALRTTDNQAG